MVEEHRRDPAVRARRQPGALAPPGEGAEEAPHRLGPQNGANDKIFYGREGAITGADREHAEVSMLALHLLQSSLVFINTRLLQAVLRDPTWAAKLTGEDRRALTPLFWAHVNPYGRFRLDMDSRLDLGTAV
ncbi:Tn3 family transposase [Nonomuraea sp. NPDC000554]|uniref:Tn3 family transposase n=1 Tax=Nonomuraea sp. NPDC000554 TaxID=3154259 RepID=UPI003323D12A